MTSTKRSTPGDDIIEPAATSPVRYLSITHVRAVTVEQAVLGMEKLLAITGRLWAPGTLRMVFAAGADQPYQAGFVVTTGPGADPASTARELRDVASVVAPWLTLSDGSAVSPWGPLGPPSHALLRGGTFRAREVYATHALAWPVCARDEHRWALAIDIDRLIDPEWPRELTEPTRDDTPDREVRCTVTVHGSGDRRDLIATLLAEDTCGPVGLVADPVRPRQPSHPTVLPLTFVAHLLATPARVPEAFTIPPALGGQALAALVETAPTPHLLVVGASGQGKTTFLEHLVDTAASRGETVAVVDVHDGKLTDAAAESCLEHGQDPELVDFAAARPPVLQLTQPPPGTEPATWAAELYAIIRDLLWGDMPDEYFGPVLQRTLRAALEALIRDPRGARPLHELPRLLDPTQDRWRDQLLARVNDPALTRTLTGEILPMLRAPDAGNTLIWLTGKLEPLTGDPYLRRVTTGPRDTTGVEDAVASGRPFLLHAPASVLGDHGSRVVVATLLHRLWLALRRRPHPAPLQLVVDEWQRYPIPTLPTMLTEGRKFGLRLRLANQNLAQLRPALRDTVLGNIGALACFRTGPADAAYLDGFFPTITRAQLQTLPRHHLALTTGDTDLITPAPAPPRRGAPAPPTG